MFSYPFLCLNTEVIALLSVAGGCEAGVEDEDSDHLLAMSLQRQDDEAGHRDQEWQQFKQQNLGPDGNPLSE